jgi:FAD/FMN-containing dehydrogenase
MRSLDGFLAAIGDVPVERDETAIRQKSRDFYWFSPVLRAELDGRSAELVVVPRDTADVVRIAAAAARQRFPLTARGAGTGTFGQQVPLAGGAIVDMTSMSRMLWIREHAFRAEAGVRLAEVDAQSRPLGGEMRMHSSTRKTATLGGFVGGGHAGVGSITWGILRDRGNILGLKVVTVEETPRVLELRGDDIQTVHHAYGVNGLITEVEMPLAPAYRWLEAILVFDDFMRATRFAFALATADGIVKKLASVLAWPIPQYFKPLAQWLPEGQHAVFAMTAAHTREAFESLAREHGARLTFSGEEGSGPRGVPLYEYTWGHTLLHAIREDRSLTYMICIFPREDTLGSIARVHDKLNRVAPLHLEMKRFDGYVTAEGVPIVRYEGPEALAALYGRFEAEGARIANAHTCLLQNGGMKAIDEAQLAFKRAADPHGLMNPGKIAGYEDAAAAASPPTGAGAALPASGWAY